MPEIQTKHCNKCGKTKPANDFYKNPKNKDGLNGFCKNCFKERSRKAYIPTSRLDNQTQNSRAGLDSWPQVDSVLREMAESQITIDREQAVCNKRIELIKKYSEEIIEPYSTHKMALEAMLTSFFKVKLSSVKTSARKFSFGKIVWHNGKVKVLLNTALAKERLGKP